VARQVPVSPSTGLSLPIGVALVVLGVAAALLGGWQHARRLGRLDRGEPLPRPLWYASSSPPCSPWWASRW
jgi:hypothetical protein